MSVPTFLKAGVAGLAIAGGVLAPSAFADQTSQNPGDASPTQGSAPVTTQSAPYCWDYAEFDAQGLGGPDHPARWRATCTVGDAGGQTVTWCEAPGGGQYKTFGAWRPAGTWGFGDLCVPGDALIGGGVE